MKGSRFSEEQIIGVLKEHEAGGTTAEVATRRQSLSLHQSRSTRLRAR